MKDLKHIKRFNTSKENFNTSKNSFKIEGPVGSRKPSPTINISLEDDDNY